MREGLRLAFTTFTVLPLRPSRVDRPTAAIALAWAPFVGALLGVAAAAVLLGARLIYPFRHASEAATIGEAAGALLSAGLAVSTLALLTRGLHLDGLADTVDGLASRKPPREALDVMKQGAIGALGAVALMFVLLLQVFALGTAVLSHRGTQALLLGVVCGRVAILWSCRVGVPAARADGMGALVAGTVRSTVAVAWTGILLAAAGAIGWVDDRPHHVLGAARAIVAVVAALFVTEMLRRHTVRRFGGITGDVLGALSEVAMVVCFIVVAAGPPSH